MLSASCFVTYQVSATPGPRVDRRSDERVKLPGCMTITTREFKCAALTRQLLLDRDPWASRSGSLGGAQVGEHSLQERGELVDLRSGKAGE